MTKRNSLVKKIYVSHGSSETRNAITMAEYIDFGVPGGPPLLIEITEMEIETSPGVLKAGLRTTKSSGAVASAQASLQSAIAGAIGQTCAALIEAMNSVRPPVRPKLSWSLVSR